MKSKRIISFLIAMLLTVCLALSACNNGQSNQGNNDDAVAAVAAAKTAVAGAVYGPVLQKDVNTAAQAKVYVEGVIGALDLKGAEYAVNQTSFTAATAETASGDGADGWYKFTVKLTKGESSDTTAEKTVVITKTPYDASAENVEIAAATAELEAEDYYASQSGVQDATAAEIEIDVQIAALLASYEVEYELIMLDGEDDSYAAVPGSLENLDGTDGWYNFTVTVSAGKGTPLTTIPLTLKVIATARLKVVFNANGGTAPDPILVEAGLQYNELETFPADAGSRTGYDYDGWYLDDGAFTQGVTGASFVANPGTGNIITLHAKWTGYSYTVVFDVNNGTGTMDSMPFVYGAAQNLTANTFTRLGYAFSGWNTAAGGTGTAYTDEQNVSNLTATKGANVTLYAQWAANTIIVTFDTNKGAGSSTPTAPGSYTNPKFGGTFGTLPTSTRTGYTTTSNTWYTAPTGGTAIISSTAINASNVPNGESITLYKQWTASAYTISFNVNRPSGASGSGSTSSMSNRTYDVEYALTKNGFTCTKGDVTWVFLGWNTAANGTGTAYMDQQNVKNLAASGTVTLYAQWATYFYTFAAAGDVAKFAEKNVPKTSADIVDSPASLNGTAYEGKKWLKFSADDWDTWIILLSEFYGYGGVSGGDSIEFTVYLRNKGADTALSSTYVEINIMSGGYQGWNDIDTFFGDWGLTAPGKFTYTAGGTNATKYVTNASEGLGILVKGNIVSYDTYITDFKVIRLN